MLEHISCVYYCYSTVIQTAGAVKTAAPPHRSQGTASCLFSKTLNVVGDVVDVATDHLAVLFAEHAEAHPDREFLVFGSRRMSYAQVQREALALADAFGGLGVQLGDRLAVDLPNWPEWVVAFLAAAYRGAVLVPLDPSLSFHELKYQLRHADVKTTLKIYAHVIPQSQRDAMENLGGQSLRSNVTLLFKRAK